MAMILVQHPVPPFLYRYNFCYVVDNILFVVLLWQVYGCCKTCCKKTFVVLLLIKLMVIRSYIVTS